MSTGHLNLSRLAAARAADETLPALFENFTIRVSKIRCFYRYYEIALPESRRDYVVFQIDPLGEIMEVKSGHFGPRP